jgi:hypothetical protein
MMDFEPRELVIEIANFCDVRVHGVLVDIPLFVDLLNHQQGITIDE